MAVPPKKARRGRGGAQGLKVDTSRRIAGRTALSRHPRTTCVLIRRILPCAMHRLDQTTGDAEPLSEGETRSSRAGSATIL